MTREEKDREFFAIAKAILADAVDRGVITADGLARRGSYSTLLGGSVPAAVTLSSFLPPRPGGDLPPEAYFHFALWPDERGPRPKGYFNTAFKAERGWIVYGDDEYRPVPRRTAALAPLVRQGS